MFDWGPKNSAFINSKQSGGTMAAFRSVRALELSTQSPILVAK